MPVFTSNVKQKHIVSCMWNKNDRVFSFKTCLSVPFSRHCMLSGDTHSIFSYRNDNYFNAYAFSRLRINPPSISRLPLQVPTQFRLNLFINIEHNI